MFKFLSRRRAAVGNAESAAHTTQSSWVSAPASMPLPSPAVPDPADVEHDAAARVEVMVQTGSLDEFTAFVFDTYYDDALVESRATLLEEANGRRHVDSVLVDSKRTQLAAARRAATRLAGHAEQQTARSRRLNIVHEVETPDG